MAATTAPSAVLGQTGTDSPTGYVYTGIGGSLDPMYSLFGHHWNNAALPMTAAQQLVQGEQAQRYNQGQIQEAYDSPQRQQQYQDYMNNLKGLYTDQVNQQQQIAARNLKFSDARSGHTGGSAAADAGAMLQNDYQSGLMTAADTARAGTDSLIAADNAPKTTAIGAAVYAANVDHPGIASAGSTLQNINTAANTATAGTLGNMFSDLGNVYQKNKAVAGANFSPYATYGSPSSSQW